MMQKLEPYAPGGQSSTVLFSTFMAIRQMEMAESEHAWQAPAGAGACSPGMPGIAVDECR
jgi:hypothetical protein